MRIYPKRKEDHSLEERKESSYTTPSMADGERLAYVGAQFLLRITV